MSQFMIEFDLPASMSEEFTAKIPLQRLKINEMMEEGRLVSYALSVDRQKLWCIVKSETEFEALEIIAEFTLIDYMKPTITELMFNNVVSMRIPLFSLN